MVATERVNFLFADGRALYGDALEMLAQGKIRNAAEKAWGATKRATDALAMARHGEEPQSAGQTLRALLRLSALDPAFDILQGNTTQGQGWTTTWSNRRGKSGSAFAFSPTTGHCCCAGPAQSR